MFFGTGTCLDLRKQGIDSFLVDVGRGAEMNFSS